MKQLIEADDRKLLNMVPANAVQVFWLAFVEVEHGHVDSVSGLPVSQNKLKRITILSDKKEKIKGSSDITALKAE